MEQIYTGIDVAKDSFVAATSLAGKVTTTLHHNDKKGIAGFLKILPSQSCMNHQLFLCPSCSNNACL